ncbi:MAG: DUF6069 family protein [Microbacterium sp.]
MVTTASAQPAATRPRARAALILTAAVAIAIALNAVVAAVAIATGAPASYGPLTPPAFGLFTALGVAAGWVGWSLVTRRAKDPRRTLSILVPLVTVASFIPDVLLLALGFIPGTTTGAVIALMVMHVVVVAVAVPAYALATRRH